MDRRQFLGWVGVGVLASSLPVAIAACNSDTTSDAEESQTQDSPTPEKSPAAANSSQEDGFVAIGTVEMLEQNGEILDDTTAAEPVIVVRNPNDNTLSAVNPTCTHKACIVGWNVETKVLACPCHGSKFALDGAVLEGPAEKPLTSYEVKEEGGSVLVKVG